jgi:hypothetical protein
MARIRALWASVAITAALLAGGLVTGSAALGAQPAGSVRPAATPMYHPAPERSLGDVSCVGASFCLGVGPYGDQVGSGNTFSQIWNGSAWRTVAVPSSNNSQGLFGVACTSTRNCLAVGGQTYDQGSQLSDHWNGSSWKMLPAPSVSGHSQLTAVACPAASKCIAVGTGGTKTRSVFAQTWNGASWTVSTPVGPAGATASYFYGVACSGRSNCLAVGQYFVSKTDFTGTALAESWNGRSWRLLPSPSGLTALNAVACPTAKVCVAVGAGPRGEFGLGSARWNGSAWTDLTTPSPTAKHYTQSLYGISCPSATNCVAVGSGPGAINDGEGAGPFAEHWTGGSGWTLQSVPDPPAIDLTPDGERNSADSLSSVSCTSPTRCLAVGGEGQTRALSAYASFAVSWNGHSWVVSRTGLVDGLMGVSCAPGGDCLMTGTYLNRGDITETLAESWNGSRVRAVSPEGLPGVLSVLSCPSASFCVAAKESSAEAWNGKRWTSGAISHTAFDGKVNGIIYGLSCSAPDFCLAIGGLEGLFAEYWNGKSWPSASLVVPKGSDVDISLTGLSCVSRDFCLTTGNYATENGEGSGGTLAEVWNGHAWKIIASPGQTVLNESINAASCTASTNCMTIGSDQANNGQTTLFAAHWNGHSWKVSKLPGTYGIGTWAGDAGGPSSLSCPTATDCVAVGSFAKFVPHKPFSDRDVALIWNGRSWRATKPGGPVGISTVSCASARDCVATGQPGITTLAKLWNGSTWKVLKTINP